MAKLTLAMTIVNALIHAVDLVVVTCSTVGLQAYLAGTPVISVEGSVFTKDASFGEFGMATPARDIAALGPDLIRAEDRASGPRQPLIGSWWPFSRL